MIKRFLGRICLAVRAFIQAWKNPEKAKLFLKEHLIQSDKGDMSHLRLLAILQSSGRLIDFLKEDIGECEDAQIGAAVRKIHEDCAKSLEDLVTIRPIMEQKEGAQVQVPRGYDPASMKIVGKVKGEPPFSGTLVHRGWKAHKRSLPKQIGEQTLDVICAAEIEVR